jgi:polyribonucleotide nucleotidyltransferase
MFDTHKVEIEWGGRPLTLETGKVARQADGAVIATYGETTVLATVVSAKSPKPGQDFFPLTVNYQEKTYAAGKIPGGFFKREGRPSENETLTSRLIDRPIRPLFPDGYKNDTQVIITVLQHDLENDPDILAWSRVRCPDASPACPSWARSAAPASATSTANTSSTRMSTRCPRSSLDLVVAGTSDAVLMVESEAKELAEDVMLGAVMFGHKASSRSSMRSSSWPKPLPRSRATSPLRIIPNSKPKCSVCAKPICARPTPDHRQAARYAAIDEVKAKVKEHFAPAEGEEPRFTSDSHRRGLQVAAGKGRPRRHPRDQEPHRRP